LDVAGGQGGRWLHIVRLRCRVLPLTLETIHSTGAGRIGRQTESARASRRREPALLSVTACDKCPAAPPPAARRRAVPVRRPCRGTGTRRRRARRRAPSR